MRYTLNTLAASAVVTGALVIGAIAGSSNANAITLIDGTTQGNYNSGLGTSLDGTDPAFPCANIACGDPSLDFPTAPDITAASAFLGNWLTTPAAPGGTWGGVQNIPANWAVNHETAIIYEIDAGAGGLQNVVADFGIDNGIFVWLDGNYLGGHTRPGGASLGEFSLNLGSLLAGTHYLQVLRADHGGGTGYAVSVTGDVQAVPIPAPLALFLTGLVGLGIMGRRRKKSTV